MNITFACPHCGQSVRSDVPADASALTCHQCGQAIAAPTDAFDQGVLCRCLVCPSRDLFVRKDFPQRLGVAVVVVGFVASSVAWAYSLPLLTFAILFATALVDLVLYVLVPDALMCYRCGAQYRLADGLERHAAFDLATYERHRQQAARMASQRL